MKTKNTSFFKPLVLAVALLGVVVACQKLNPLDGLDVAVNDEVTVSPVLLRFTNANVQSTTTLPDFAVTISGKDASLVRMDGGSTNFKVINGMLPLYLTSTANPSPTSPLTFNIYAEVPGFSAVSQTIKVTTKDISVMSIPLVEIAKPVNGVNIGTSTNTITSGTVSSTTTIATVPSGDTPEKTTVTIPAGTKVQDASGNVISSNTLVTEIVQLDPNAPQAVNSFPGGYSPTNVVDQNGQPFNNGQGINFVSAGLVTINMSAGDKDVKTFSQPIKVSMDIDPTVTNFETGTTIKAGDIVPLWSLNEETGQWKSEGNVTIKNNNGKLSADFETTHLTSFNLDWWWSAFGGHSSCNNPLTVTFHGKKGVYEVTFETEGGQYLGAAHYASLKDGQTVTFPYVPNIAKAKITLRDVNTYKLLTQTDLFNPCGVTAKELTYGTNIPDPNEINVGLKVVSKCVNKNLSINSSGWFWFWDQTAWNTNREYIYACAYIYRGQLWYLWGTNFDYDATTTTYTTSLFMGHDYQIGGYYNGVYRWSPKFTLSKANLTLAAGAASAMGVTGIYNPLNNTLNITATFTPTCN